MRGPRQGRPQRSLVRAARALLGPLALPLALCACGSSQRPNLLLIGVDTLRADHLSAYGHGRATSPRLDRWAASGTLYERAYAPASWTLPSMAMLMTGHLRSDNSGDIGPREATLAERMAAAGYRCNAVVSNPLLSPAKGYDRGFEQYELFAPKRPGRSNGWPAQEVVERGWRQIEQASTAGAWFEFLFLFDPHDPYAPAGGLAFAPFESQDRKSAFQDALPLAERELFTAAVYAEIERQIALYDSEILTVDGAIGQLLDRLDQAGHSEDTLIAFTSDHGEGLWQRARLKGEEDKQGAYFPALYFDHGVMLYEEQIHVPLILAGPGVPSGQRVEDPVWTLDVVPTMERYFGLEPIEDLLGRDLLDQGALRQPRDLLAFTSRGACLIDQGRYKLHVPREYRVLRHGAEPEWYDLENDPGERSDRFDESPREGELARLAAWTSRGQRSGSNNRVDPAILEALGYTESMTER
jgi:arylsulfatase A-like enzyme